MCLYRLFSGNQVSEPGVNVALHSLLHKCETSPKSMNSGEFFFFFTSLSQPDTYVNPLHVPKIHIYQARLLSLKICGGFINHLCLPLVKSSLSQCKREAGTVEDLGLISRRTRGRTSDENSDGPFLRTSWESSSSSDRFYCCSVGVAAK